jgi:hypothetical protein
MKKRIIAIGTLFLFFTFAFFTVFSSQLKYSSDEDGSVYAGNKRQMAQSGTKFCCKNNQTTSCGAVKCTD